MTRLQPPSPVSQKKQVLLLQKLVKFPEITIRKNTKLILKPDIGLKKMILFLIPLVGIIFILVFWLIGTPVEHTWDTVFRRPNMEIPGAITLFFAATFTLLGIMYMATNNYYCIDLQSRQFTYHMNIFHWSEKRPAIPLHDFYCVAVQILYADNRQVTSGEVKPSHWKYAVYLIDKKAELYQLTKFRKVYFSKDEPTQTEKAATYFSQLLQLPSFPSRWNHGFQVSDGKVVHIRRRAN